MDYFLNQGQEGPRAEATGPSRKPLLRSAHPPFSGRLWRGSRILDALISALDVTRVAPVLKFPFCVVLQKISRERTTSSVPLLFRWRISAHYNWSESKFHKLGCRIAMRQKQSQKPLPYCFIDTAFLSPHLASSQESGTCWMISQLLFGEEVYRFSIIQPPPICSGLGTPATRGYAHSLLSVHSYQNKWAILAGEITSLSRVSSLSTYAQRRIRPRLSALPITRIIIQAFCIQNQCQ